MSNPLVTLKALIAGLFLTGASFFGVHTGNQSLGATPVFNPTQAAPAFLSGAGIGSTDVSIPLTAFTTRQGSPITTANIGGILFVTIDPGTIKEENVSCTGITQNASNGTATLTGCLRGLLPVYPYSPSSSVTFAHSGGATVITSNSAPFQAQFNIAANTSTITGNWTFASSSLPSVSSDTPTSSFTSFNFVDKQYADALSFSGVANADFNTKGIVQLATSSQLGIGIATGSTGASIVIPNILVHTTSTSNAVVATGASSTIDASFINGDSLNLQTVNVSGTLNVIGTTTLSKVVITQAIQFSTSSYVLGAYFSGAQSGSTSSATWTVPSNVTSVTIFAFGAQGQSATSTELGGASSGTLAVMAGTTYTISFSGYGVGGTCTAVASPNGGNYAAMFTTSTANVANTSTIVIVAGGGGAGNSNGSNTGGSGGGTTGGTADGGGGTQSAGGAGGSGSANHGSSGTLLQGGGGACSANNSGGGGGGGGLFGGGGGSTGNTGAGSAAGGGSGFVSNTLTSAQTTQGINTGIPYLYIVYNIATAHLSPNAGTVQWGNINATQTIPFSSNFSTTPSCSLGASQTSTWPYYSVTSSSITLNYTNFSPNMFISYTCF